MKCRKVQPKLSCWLDDECPSREREAIRAHLDLCPDCRRQLASYQGLQGRLRASPPLSGRPVDLTLRVMGALPLRARSRFALLPEIAAYAALFLLVFALSWMALPRPTPPVIAAAAAGPEPIRLTMLLEEPGQSLLAGIESTTLQALGAGK